MISLDKILKNSQTLIKLLSRLCRIGNIKSSEFASGVLNYLLRRLLEVEKKKQKKSQGGMPTTGRWQHLNVAKNAPNF